MSITVGKKIEKFFLSFPQKVFQKHQLISGGGKHFSSVFYITSGYVKQYIVSSDGVELTTMIYGPGEMFSLIWVITGKERKLRFFEAMTPVITHQCSPMVFREFLLSEAELSVAILEQLATRLDGLLQRITYMTVAQSAQKKIYVLLVLLCQRFGRKDKRHLLPFRLTHKDIASFLGLSRETVSIAVKKLIDKRVLFYEDHFFGVNLYKHMDLEQKELRDILS